MGHKCHLNLVLARFAGLPIHDLCTCGSTSVCVCVCVLIGQEVACMHVPSYRVVILRQWQKAHLDLVCLKCGLLHRAFLFALQWRLFCLADVLTHTRACKRSLPRSLLHPPAPSCLGHIPLPKHKSAQLSKYLNPSKLIMRRRESE